jgi:hypothetical protein
MGNYMGISLRKYIKMMICKGFSLEQILADVVDNYRYSSVKNLWRIFTKKEKEIVSRDFVVSLKDNIIKRK